MIGPPPQQLGIMNDTNDTILLQQPIILLPYDHQQRIDHSMIIHNVVLEVNSSSITSDHEPKLCNCDCYCEHQQHHDYVNDHFTASTISTTANSYIPSNIEIPSSSSSQYHHHLRTNIQRKERQRQQQRRRRRRRMMISETSTTTTTTDGSTATNDDDEKNSKQNILWNVYIPNILAVLVCLCIAALAAGLTVGMLGLDPLLLLIKQRAAESIYERQAATSLLPIIQQHHLLLVTLLLCNAIVNEALPLFLENLVNPTTAVILSVTCVLLFGEIIPSAIFTGPNQLYIAHSLVPLVKMMLCILYPIAGPIASLLDYFVHHHDIDNDDDDNNVDHGSKSLLSASYTRGELAALIRIQYEERIAMKRQLKQRKQRVTKHDTNTTTSSSSIIDHDHIVGALNFTPRQVLLNASSDYQSIRAMKNQANHGTVIPISSTNIVSFNSEIPNETFDKSDHHNESRPMMYHQHHISNRDDDDRWHDSSIHPDEILMIEGALQMQTKVAMDVYTPNRRVFSIPSTMILNERNMVKIYASGFSRIPVHLPNQKTAIIGILVTKTLIVVNPKENRPISTLPLRLPRCVSPSMPLVDLLNMFQSGGSISRGGGHLALVCARPSVGEQIFLESSMASSKSLSHIQKKNDGITTITTTPPATIASLPESAGLMGIITLEDVIEMLLQEQIYDEMDQREQKALQVIVKAIHKWKRYIQRKKNQTQMNDTTNNSVPSSMIDVADTTIFHDGQPKILSIIEQAMMENHVDHKSGTNKPAADETTFLLTGQHH